MPTMPMLQDAISYVRRKLETGGNLVNAIITAAFIFTSETETSDGFSELFDALTREFMGVGV